MKGATYSSDIPGLLKTSLFYPVYPGKLHEKFIIEVVDKN